MLLKFFRVTVYQSRGESSFRSLCELSEGVTSVEVGANRTILYNKVISHARTVRSNKPILKLPSTNLQSQLQMASKSLPDARDSMIKKAKLLEATVRRLNNTNKADATFFGLL